MALQKDIELDNGIILNYHRIININQTINETTDIIVASYVNENKRREEQHYKELQDKEDRTPEEDLELENHRTIFYELDFIKVPYNKDMNVDSAYKYLVTLDKYKNAKDC